VIWLPQLELNENISFLIIVLVTWLYFTYSLIKLKKELEKEEREKLRKMLSREDEIVWEVKENEV
jgi:preprotein translocase subunit YajC